MPGTEGGIIIVEGDWVDSVAVIDGRAGDVFGTNANVYATVAVSSDDTGTFAVTILSECTHSDGDITPKFDK